MREDMQDAVVDLIYLDPPFNSKRIYNASMDGAQWVAFDDTWQWYEAIDDFDDVASDVELSPTMEGLRRILGEGTTLAYLSYMANRLRECRRVLKPTGSIYLHCDPTMSHYLKIVMDAIFERRNFRNEIIWKRANTVKSNTRQGAKGFGRNTDTILFYTSGDSYIFHQPYTEYSPEYIDNFYKHTDGDGRKYQLISMSGPGGAAKGNPEYKVMGVKRYWRYSKDRMQGLIDAGLVVQTKPGTVPRRKLFLDEGKGVSVQSLWDDISALHSQSKDRLGYPTQKPVALLDRIIKASTNEGDIVFDPFCGCGTTLHAAQTLGRQWVGSDICVKACQVIEDRLTLHFDSLWNDVEFIGIPKTVSDAKTVDC